MTTRSGPYCLLSRQTEIRDGSYNVPDFSLGPGDVLRPRRVAGTPDGKDSPTVTVPAAAFASVKRDDRMVHPQSVLHGVYVAVQSDG